MPDQESIRAGHRNWSETLTIIVLSVVTTLVLLVSMDRSVNVYDESIVLVGALRILAGEVPHRDFATNYGPAQFHALAGLFNLFGISVLIERLWDTFIRVVTAVLLYLLLRRAVPPASAFWNAFIGAAWLAYVQFHGYPLLPAFTLSIASLVLMSHAVWRRLSPPHLLFSGLCIGLASGFRYDIGLAGFVCMVFIAATGSWLSNGDPKKRIRDPLRAIAWLTLGFGSAVVPLATYLALQGAMPDLLFQVVTFPAEHYVRTRSLPFPEISLNVDVFVYLPFLVGTAGSIVLLGIPYRLFMHARGKHKPGPGIADVQFPEWLLLSLLLLIGMFTAKGFVRTSLIHMAPAIVLAGPVMTLSAHVRASHGNALKALISCCFVIICAVPLGFVGKVLAFDFPRTVMSDRGKLFSDSFTITTAPWGGPCPVIRNFEHLACFGASQDLVATAKMLQKMTQSQDRVFVGLPSHDKIVANDMLLYFAAQRLPATKWHHFDPGLQTSLAVQRQIVEELRHGPIKAVVLVDHWSHVSEPNDSSVGSGITLLDDYIRQAYEPVATYGAYSIWKPK